MALTGSLIRGPADTLPTLPGSYLGPVIRRRRGQQVRVRFASQLGEDSIVHWHGLNVPDNADGHPRLAVGRGQEYQGLAGLLLVSHNDEDALALPSGEAELLCGLQDRRFDSRNQLVDQGGGQMAMMNGFLGDRALVSGQPQPTREVDAGCTACGR